MSHIIDPVNLTRKEAEEMSLEDSAFVRECLIQAIKGRDGYKSAWYSDREFLDKAIKHYQDKIREVNYFNESSAGEVIADLDLKVEALQEYRKNTQGSELE